MIKIKEKDKHATYSYIVDNLLKEGNKRRKLRIIDFGCGDGSIINYFPSKFIRKYFGWDKNENSILRAKQIFEDKKYYFEKTDKTVPNFSKITKNSDLVISVGVMQYLNKKQSDSFIKESYKSLKSSGLLLVSTATDHFIYKLIDIYRFFIPHHYVDKNRFVRKLINEGFKIDRLEEKGLILSPIFMNIGTLVVDSIDKLVYRNKGYLGPLGRGFREYAAAVTEWEYKLPINYGYTLYIKAHK